MPEKIVVTHGKRKPKKGKTLQFWFLCLQSSVVFSDTVQNDKMPLSGEKVKCYALIFSDRLKK